MSVTLYPMAYTPSFSALMKCKIYAVRVDEKKKPKVLILAFFYSGYNMLLQPDTFLYGQFL